MEIIDTSKTKITLNKDTRFFLQNGTNLEGLSGGNFPLHTATFNVQPILREIDTDRSTYCTLKFTTDDISLYESIKPGDPLYIIRGSMKRFYICENIFNGLTGSTSSDMYITLMQRETTDSFEDLDHFIGENGYPYADESCVLDFNRRLETNVDDRLLDFELEFNELERTDTYSINLYVNFDYTVKNTRLRWRTVPSNQQISSIHFSMTGSATANGPVPISVSSDTGRGTVIEFEIGATPSLITNLNVIDEGGGYLSIPIIDIDESNIDGISTLEIIPNLHINTEGRVDYIRVIDGGTGYTGVSVSVPFISGVINGATAEGYAEIEDGKIVNIVMTNHGYGFTKAGETPATSYVIDGDGTGAVLEVNIDSNSSWVYEDPTIEKNITLSGFKKNLRYEIQVVGSDTEIFKGIYKYSPSIVFSYY